MKKIALYLAGVIFLTISSCSQENEGTIYDLHGKDYVSFPLNEVSVGIDINATYETFIFSVAHVNTSVAGTKATISILDKTSDALKAIFSIPEPNISFKQGTGQENVTIKFDRSALIPGETYTFQITYKSDTDPYPLTSRVDTMTISVALELNWKKVASGTFASEFYGESWPQDMEQSVEVATLYRFPDLYYADYPIIFSMSADGKITFNRQKVGETYPGYGPININMPAATSPDQPYKEGNVIYLYSRLVVPVGTGWGVLANGMEKYTIDAD